ncbi:MAG: holo-ACP synthase [Acidimicrobiales bacterium]
MTVLGLGIDAVDVADFRARLDRRAGLAQRLFSPAERAWAAGLADPAPRLAARFAAKEATMKAMGVGLGAFGWWEVEVIRATSGQPHLMVSGGAAALAQARGVGSWRLSLTHTATVAEAVVLALAPDPEGERPPRGVKP